jgi:uncharacterized membrane protein
MRDRHLLRIAGLALAATSLFAGSAHAGPASDRPKYEISDFGDVEGFTLFPLDINDQGQVVGVAAAEAPDPDGAFSSQGFLWLPEASGGLDAGLHLLGTLGGPSSSALAIGDELRIVGTGDTPELVPGLPFSIYVSPATAWQGLQILNLGFAEPRMVSYYADLMDLNRHGQAVGGQGRLFGCRPVIYLPQAAHGRPAGLQYLFPSSLTREGAATGINDHGQVVGWVSDCDRFPRRGFLWLPEPPTGARRDSRS